MTHFSNITGLVLASGRSSRMGQNKALLQWQGQPMYQFMAGLLKQAGVGRVVINQEGVGDEFMTDLIPDCGPLSGIHAVLKSGATADDDSAGILVVPVDMPLLEPADLIHLMTEYDGARPLQYQGYSLPLLLPANSQVVALAEQALASDNRRHFALWRLFEKLNGRTLEPPARHKRSFANTNTPEEWQDVASIESDDQ